MTGGSFNTREFFHGASARAVRMARVGFQVLGFGLPLLLLAWALLSGSALAWLLALASQAAGLLAERWFFFAQARHPQNTRPCRDAGAAVRALAETCAKIPL